jgi:hypothetical protein
MGLVSAIRSAARVLALTLLTVPLISRAEGRSSQVSATRITSGAFAISAQAIEPPDSVDLSLTPASPVATKTRFMEAHVDAAQVVPLAPARTPDGRLMLLVSVVLVAHQLRRKQRSLNHQFTR